jgi:hypothetical protein
VKGLTRREAINVQFGRRGSGERDVRREGRYHVEKQRDDGTWGLMAVGEPSQVPGHELDRLLRCAEALEGTVRIVRAQDGVIVWPIPKAALS